MRRTDAFVQPQFWAEDAFFFERNYTEGLRVIFQPYNGYLHLVPRLIAVVSSWLDVRWAPTCYVYLSLAGMLYVAARTFSPRFPFKFHPALILAVALVPDAPDILLNPTNLQSILAAGLVLLLISRDPETPGGIAHDLTALVVLGLTGPTSVLLAPLFALRACVRRTRWSVILALVAAICGAIQLAFILTHPLPPEPPENIKPALALPVLGARVFGSVFLGGRISVDQQAGLLAALGIGTLVWLLVSNFWPRDSRLERGLLAASCALLLAATLYRMRYALPQTMHRGFGARYFYAPQLIVIWQLVTLLPNPTAIVRRTAAALLLLAVSMNVTRLLEPKLLDMHWANYVSKIRNHEKVDVPINPSGWNMGLNADKK